MLRHLIIFCNLLSKISNMALRVLIADDEPAARERLRHFLEKESDIQLVAECADGISALTAIREHSPDLVFLDIRMPALNGFEIIRRLVPEPVPPIIFVSAHEDHAVEAFDFCAVDYLLKPFDRDRFRRALLLGREAVLHRETRSGNGSPEFEQQSENQENTTDRLAVRSPGKIKLLIFSEILWIQGAGNYVEVHLEKQTHLLRQTMNDLEKALPSRFVRISKSHIVNLDWVRELKPKSHGDCFIFLRNETEIIGTRSYRVKLRKKLGM